MIRPIQVSLVLALAISLIGAASAAAAPKVDGTFDLTGVPGRITEGPDGNVWVLLSGSANEIARVEPNGTVTEYDSDDLNGAVGIAKGPDDRLWVTKTGAVASFDPADPTVVAVTAIAAVAAQDIVAGPDGNLWTPGNDTVLQIPPDDPGNPVPHAVAGLGGRGIAVGGDGRIWVADFGSQRIIRMTTDGTFTEIAVGGGPQQVAAGPGEQIAYTNPGAIPQLAGLISPPQAPKEIEMPNTDPFGIVFAPDGAYWSSRFAGNDLARITPQGTLTSLGGLPAGSGPRYLANGAGNTLWVSLETSQQIARVSGVEAAKPPRAKITKAPKAKVGAKRGRVRVKFRFESAVTGAGFRCSLAKRGSKADFRRCKSPQTYRVKPGRYEFRVAAKAGGLTGKPDTARFRVIRR